MFAGMHWFSVSQRDARVTTLFARHYSSGKNGRKLGQWLRYGIAGPGETMTLLLADASALFIWLKQEYRMDDQTGVNCAVFRNESGILSSTLILEAERLAWARWPGERLYTFVDPAQVRSANPGYCFLMAGWRRLPERTSRGLVVLEKGAPSTAVGDGPAALWGD